ncbi:hypothetical protein AGR5A_Cc100024 [Agrobacterium genomosp. 5 str. CFBP 6626]|nr:hypothetical protein AGR5A_Cc100024 [Agrobacterium genomosp. 5 str. CFBP 6626]
MGRMLVGYRGENLVEAYGDLPYGFVKERR